MLGHTGGVFRECAYTAGKEEGGADILSSVDICAAKAGDSLEVGTQGLLQLVPSPTPRWPDLLVAYMPSERLLFTSKLFSAHVRCVLTICLACTTHLPSLLLLGKQSESAMSSERLVSARIHMSHTDSWPNVNMCRQQCMAHKQLLCGALAVLRRLASQKGEATDKGGWERYSTDWRSFFECMLAPVARQAAGGRQSFRSYRHGSRLLTLGTQATAVLQRESQILCTPMSKPQHFRCQGSILLPCVLWHTSGHDCHGMDFNCQCNSALCHVA